MEDSNKLFHNINTYLSIINDKVKLNKFLIKADKKFNIMSKERISVSNQIKKFSNHKKYKNNKENNEHNEHNKQRSKSKSNEDLMVNKMDKEDNDYKENKENDIKNEYLIEKNLIQNEYFMKKSKKLSKKIYDLRNKVNITKIKSKSNDKQETNKEDNKDNTNIHYKQIKYDDLKNEIDNEYKNFQNNIQLYNAYITSISMKNEKTESDDFNLKNKADFHTKVTKIEGKDIKRLDFNLFLNYKNEILKTIKPNDSYYNSYNFQRLFDIINKEDLNIKRTNKDKKNINKIIKNEKSEDDVEYKNAKERVEKIINNKVRIYSKDEIENRVLLQKVESQKKIISSNDNSTSMTILKGNKSKNYHIGNRKKPVGLLKSSSSTKKKNPSKTLKKYYKVENVSSNNDKFLFHNLKFDNEEGKEDENILDVGNIFKEEVIEKKLRDYNSISDFEVFRIDSLMRSLNRMNKKNQYMDEYENKEEYEKLINSLIINKEDKYFQVKSDLFSHGDAPNINSGFNENFIKKRFYTNKLNHNDNESLLLSLDNEMKKVKNFGIELYKYKPNKKNENSMFISYKK